MIRMFKSNDYVEAVELKDFTSIQEIIQLTGMGVTVAFSPAGALQSVTLNNGTFTALLGQYVYKNKSGTVGVCGYDYLAENYPDEVAEPTAE